MVLPLPASSRNISGNFKILHRGFQNHFIISLLGISTLLTLKSQTFARTGQPSRQDEELARKIKEAGSYLDIKVLDHLIVTNKSYYASTDESLLWPFLYCNSTIHKT
jgi:hypothetical protein